VVAISCIVLLSLLVTLGWMVNTILKRHGGRMFAAHSAPTMSTNDLWRLLNDNQRAVVSYMDERFGKYSETRDFSAMSALDRANLEQQLLPTLSGKRSDELFRAINTLAALRSSDALPQLRRLAFDPAAKTQRTELSNRARWMSARALGSMGDQLSTPRLMHLLYHNNSYVRWMAQVTLVRLTGTNFGGNWQQWVDWWKQSKGQPTFDTATVQWATDQADLDELATQLQSDDKRFLAMVHRKSDDVDTDTPVDDNFWVKLDRRNYQRYRQQLNKAPRVLIVRPTHYDINSTLAAKIHYGWIDNRLANLSVSFSEAVCYALGDQARADEELLLRTEMPAAWHNGQMTNRFDIIDTVRAQPVQRLQEELKRMFKEDYGLSWRPEMRDTDILVITVKNPRLLASKISTNFAESASLGEAARDWGNFFNEIVLEETHMTNRFQKDFVTIPAAYVPNRTKDLAVNNAFLVQFGLELAPASRSMQWFVLDSTSTSTNTTIDVR
jgi:hypothetical protein